MLLMVVVVVVEVGGGGIVGAEFSKKRSVHVRIR